MTDPAILRTHDTLDDIPSPAVCGRIVGHEARIGQLLRAYASGRMPHAIVLDGTKGIGKASIAYALARLVTTNGPASAGLPAYDPDNPAHRQIAQNASHDFLAIARFADDEGKAKTQITVEQVRQIGAMLSHRAQGSGWRVVLVDGAEEMNRNAANALLKNLEEPPPRTLFVLVTHRFSRLLPTIRSRCQRFHFEALRPQELVDALRQLGYEAAQGDPGGERLCATSGGSVRMALQLTAFGGNEISEAIESSVTGRGVDVATAHRLAGSLAGRESELQLQMFSDFVRQRIEQQARGAALAGNGTVAARLSEQCSAFDSMRRDMEIYNLDKKQFVLSALHLLASA